MKWLGYAIFGILMVTLMILGVGMVLPSQHTAAVRVQLQRAPQEVFDAIVDVEHATSWRSGLDSVRVISRQPLRWKESADWGTLEFVMDEATSPARVVSRIADTAQGFGGTWTYEIEPTPAGSTVTITEHGEVANPLFRFMSKFVFGHYTSLETYARDLGGKFHQTVQSERLR